MYRSWKKSPSKKGVPCPKPNPFNGYVIWQSFAERFWKFETLVPASSGRERE